MSFESLGLCETLLKNVRRSGYAEPTPIQRETIPLVLSGRDVLGCAQTGTGKTAAFALPILQRLRESAGRAGKANPEVKRIRALVLSPTRELAQQTYDCFQLYGRGMGQTPCVLFGGVSQVSQEEALHRGADIAVACPGRLLDLMGQGLIRLESLEVFVLDEADRMLDMGFIHDVRRVMKALPAKRQTLLFSATMPPEVEKLALDLLSDPETVKVDPVTSTVDAIDQCLYYVDKGNKRHLLARLLADREVENALVFSRTRHGVDRIVRDLKRAGIDAAGIHGDKSQGARQTALSRFKSGECRVLVATDIAARGIDIAGLSHVINYDLPMEPESYIHRIGRTGRAGRSGKAISFCCIDEKKQLNQVEKLIGKRLREEQSEWPMEILTPSAPKVPAPRPGRRPQPAPEKPEALRKVEKSALEKLAEPRKAPEIRKTAEPRKPERPPEPRKPADLRKTAGPRKPEKPPESRKPAPAAARQAPLAEPVRRQAKRPAREEERSRPARPEARPAPRPAGNLLREDPAAREEKPAPRLYDPNQHPGTPLRLDEEISFEKFFPRSGKAPG